MNTGKLSRNQIPKSPKTAENAEIAKIREGKAGSEAEGLVQELTKMAA